MTELYEDKRQEILCGQSWCENLAIRPNDSKICLGAKYWWRGLSIRDGIVRSYCWMMRMYSHPTDIWYGVKLLHTVGVSCNASVNNLILESSARDWTKRARCILCLNVSQTGKDECGCIDSNILWMIYQYWIQDLTKDFNIVFHDNQGSIVS